MENIGELNIIINSEISVKDFHNQVEKLLAEKITTLKNAKVEKFKNVYRIKKADGISLDFSLNALKILESSETLIPIRFYYETEADDELNDGPPCAIINLRIR